MAKATRGGDVERGKAKYGDTNYGNTYAKRSGPSLAATPQWVAAQIAALPQEVRQRLLEEIRLRKMAAEFCERGYSERLVAAAVRACS